METWNSLWRSEFIHLHSVLYTLYSALCFRVKLLVKGYQDRLAMCVCVCVCVIVGGGGVEG